MIATSSAASPATGRPRTPLWKRVIKRGAAYALVMVSLWWIIGCAIQRQIMFPRGMTTPLANAGQNVAGLEKVWIESPQGRVEGWFLPGAGVTAENPGPALLFAHGNAELIDYLPKAFDELRAKGVSVFLAEFRGYGRSAGSPSQANLTDDFVKFYDWLAARPEVDKQRIVFQGRSIGGGVVCAMAAKRPPAAMILLSSFTSAKAMAAKFLYPGFLVMDPFDNEAVVATLDCPILFMHGSRDGIVPYEHGVALNAAAKRGRLITYACDHNDLPPDWKVYCGDIEQFLLENGILR